LKPRKKLLYGKLTFKVRIFSGQISLYKQEMESASDKKYRRTSVRGGSRRIQQPDNLKSGIGDWVLGVE